MDSEDNEKEGGREVGPVAHEPTAEGAADSGAVITVDEVPRTSGIVSARTKGHPLRWAVLSFPACAALELLLHAWQVSNVVPESDWVAAKQIVASAISPDDTVFFAPKWEDPNGRRFFGPEIMTLARAARSDDDRFKHAFEVSFEGKSRSELAHWSLKNETKAGKLTVRTYENPGYKPITEDLLRKVNPSALSVSRVDGGREAPCSWLEGRVQSGGLYYPFGPPLPGSQFSCANATVGVGIFQDLEHDARQCLYAAPPGGSAVLRFHFKEVAFAKVIAGHHGLHYSAERWLTGTPVTLTFSSAGTILGRATHTDGQGWSGFEIDTQALAGKTGELTIDVQSASPSNRLYCFAAVTR
jgi:hypothetical protein